ncbi:hypothetical protein CA54_42550 [Symmachiella macrocystis]|uniref:Uncharacterized protein n=1 Tax=Symmachiella macrocystis TaxID=2527985 RepID=A0A5C6B9R8_9PLAN|nr:hypothetical protein CA54_42550 [Symmachiella macrocystis]
MVSPINFPGLLQTSIGSQLFVDVLELRIDLLESSRDARFLIRFGVHERMGASSSLFCSNHERES